LIYLYRRSSHTKLFFCNFKFYFNFLTLQFIFSFTVSKNIKSSIISQSFCHTCRLIYLIASLLSIHWFNKEQWGYLLGLDTYILWTFDNFLLNIHVSSVNMISSIFSISNLSITFFWIMYFINITRCHVFIDEVKVLITSLIFESMYLCITK